MGNGSELPPVQIKHSMKIYEMALDKKEDYDELAEELGLNIE
jgi:hypothetical protein